jgi:hypothetical protein
MADFTPYDQSHRVSPLLLVFTIVNAGQGEAIANIYKKAEAYAAYFLNGKGTAPNNLYAVLGSAGALKKDVILGVIKTDRWESLRQAIDARFAVSKLAKGVSFTVPLDSVAGVSIYKMLSNTRYFEKAQK